MEKEDIELQKVKQQSSNGLLYTLGGIIVLLLVFIGYLYTSYNMVDKSKPVSKKETKSQNITFDSLPYSIKENYITVAEHKNMISAQNEKLQACNQKLSNIPEPKVEEKIVKVDNVVEKIVEVEKVIYKEKKSIDRSNFKTFRCYDMQSSGYHPTIVCKERLKAFLDENKDDTKLFEVIGVVNDKDFRLLKNLKDVYKEARVDKLGEFAQYGLSRKRVIEATWIIVDHLKSSEKVSNVNYTVTSKRGHKGFVVRAYR